MAERGIPTVREARPAAPVVVPEWPGHRWQILSVAPDQYPQVAQVLSVVGARLQPTSSRAAIEMARRTDRQAIELAKVGSGGRI